MTCSEKFWIDGQLNKTDSSKHMSISVTQVLGQSSYSCSCYRRIFYFIDVFVVSYNKYVVMSFDTCLITKWML